MKKLTIIILAIFSTVTYAQDCSCESNFNWVKQTFEENDAGFSYAIEKKGKQAYEKHNEVFLKKVKSISDPAKCSQMLFKWLQFFRSGHISVSQINQPKNQGESKKLTDNQIRETYKNSERLDVNEAKFRSYLESKKEVDYEGVWVSKPYKIGIKRVDNHYVGFIIEADGVYWTKGQVKFKIQTDNTAVYFMQNHSLVDISTTELLGKNYIQMGFISLKRETPKYKVDEKVDQYFKSLSASKPYFESIDENTTYLRIPSFNISYKKQIDSIISANKNQILKTPNFIIDIRNNGGGSDNSYKELLPILYTNPIRTVGVEFYSTVLNNKRMLDFIKDEKYSFDEDGKKWAKESYEKLTKELGGFVNLNPNVVSLTKYDTIYKYPKNVGIIINENNGSTSEQFLLSANQSKKVKLYGSTTAGVLDISNMYFVKSPCNDFELGYCLTRSMRIPHMSIDDKGIQPDYFIDRSVPKQEWLDFVLKSMKD